MDHQESELKYTCKRLPYNKVQMMIQFFRKCPFHNNQALKVLKDLCLVATKVRDLET